MEAGRMEGMASGNAMEGCPNHLTADLPVCNLHLREWEGRLRERQLAEEVFQEANQALRQARQRRRQVQRIANHTWGTGTV